MIHHKNDLALTLVMEHTVPGYTLPTHIYVNAKCRLYLYFHLIHLTHQQDIGSNCWTICTFTSLIDFITAWPHVIKKLNSKNKKQATLLIKGKYPHIEPNPLFSKILRSLGYFPQLINFLKENMCRLVKIAGKKCSQLQIIPSVLHMALSPPHPLASPNPL